MAKWITLSYTKNGSTFSSVDESRLQQYTDMMNLAPTTSVAQLISNGTANGSITATPTLLANGSGHQTNLVFNQYIVDNYESVRLFIKDPIAYFANTTEFGSGSVNSGQKVANGFSSAGWTVSVVDKNY